MTAACPAYSRTLDRALELAAEAHREQVRKGTGVPYVMHPVHVSILLMKHGFPEAVVVAGLLHDVVEDTNVSLESIEGAFGSEVAALVGSVTEIKTETAGGAEVRRPWRIRKEEQLLRLDAAPPLTAALKAADAIHNCESTLRELDRVGPEAWERFRAPPEDQLWYFRSIATRVRKRLGDHPIARELEATIERLAARVAG